MADLRVVQSGCCWRGHAGDQMCRLQVGDGGGDQRRLGAGREDPFAERREAGEGALVAGPALPLQG